jgi:hypothetical protein
MDTRLEDFCEEDPRKELDEDEDVLMVLVLFNMRATANSIAVARELELELVVWRLFALDHRMQHDMWDPRTQISYLLSA